MINKEVIHGFVDESLRILKELDLLSLPHPNMPAEMVDRSKTPSNDWIPWKAVPSQVTNADIQEIEAKIGLKLPEPYVVFLKYKHFYDLDNPKEITFFRHCIRDWKRELYNNYFDSWEPEEIIGKGYIPFGDFSDWGIICFNTNKRVNSNNDCEIVRIDHELLYNNPVPKDRLYASFIDMIKDLSEEQKKNQQNA
ncbi:putative glucan synthasis protein [Flammeovirgaceae bacterium 311]|nr:putative glucan synthasis protein [Flammeovirgaceae bacterium 311]